MRNHFFHSPRRWKDSISVGLAIFATVETFFAITNINLASCWGDWKWYEKLLCILLLFSFVVFIIFLLKNGKVKRGISININGITVNIKVGDIFKAKGWKIISFNEYYDTIVDDIIIAHNTINGKFIDNYVSDINELNKTIQNTDTDINTNHKRFIKKSTKRTAFPLGRIIVYKNEWMLLSFAHFDQNQVHLTQKDYEECLRIMWNEISRIYANRQINVPLLGSGIARFDDAPNKSKSSLLKCMLCTLKNSRATINQPINILLTKEVLEELNIYELKHTLL